MTNARYFLKALADPTRINFTSPEEPPFMHMRARAIALNLTEPNASYHLNLLERKDIVKTERMGKWVSLSQTFQLFEIFLETFPTEEYILHI